MKNTQKNPYSIIVSRYTTEKSMVLEGLKDSESNKYVARCESPKYVFLVDRSANKKEIGAAVEEIYKEQNIKVLSVNTLNTKSKPKRRGRARKGFTKVMKKAIVTLEKGDSLDNI